MEEGEGNAAEIRTSGEVSIMPYFFGGVRIRYWCECVLVVVFFMI